jgi:GDPmannose 4,6-dehydratase
VREFLDAAFGIVGLNWEPYVEIDPAYYRPTEVDYLQADPSLAEKELGWKPEVTFDQLVNEMVVSDLAEVGLTLPDACVRVKAGHFP